MSCAMAVYTIGLTLGAYALSRRLHRLWASPLTTPVFCSTAFVVAALMASHLGYAEYAPARRILGWFIGPATVALAIPLHRNRRLLAACLAPSLIGLIVGALSTIWAAIALSRLLGLSGILQRSLALKSVTAAVAVEIAGIVHADPTLTAAFVVVTGMLGAMIGPWLLDRIGVLHPVARGLALGAISHGQGTAQAALESEISGAIAGIAMGLSAVFCSLVAPSLLSHL
jgi:putative effector of murein hydrolase